jgi:ATP-dependent DNA helicase RecG
MKEHQHVEWKESWRDEYLKWVCGFANAEGGVLVIGRNDKGVAVGAKGAKKLLEDIPNKVRDVLGIMVDVNLLEEAGKELLEIHVEPYPSPVSYKGEYHYRSGSTKQELKGAALSRFLLKKYGLQWDGVPVPGLSLGDCSASALQWFRDKAARSGRLDEAVLGDGDAALLSSLQLDEGEHLKRAAALLFGKQPERFVPGAWIKIGFFVTDDDLRYQDEIHGDLFAQVEKALELLHTKYLKAYISYEGIQRLETFLFPRQALREALLNAVIHKDYGSGIPIQISVYEHQIVLWNAGHLPEGWTLDRLLGKHPSRPANPLLANAFFRAGYIESWGRGIEKIARECREHDINPPNYDFGMSGLMLTFRANPAHLPADLGGDRVGDKVGDRVGDKVGEDAGESAGEKLTENQRHMLMLLKQNNRLSARELAEGVGISARKVEENLSKLKAIGCLRRIGSAKGGHWEVLN